MATSNPGSRLEELVSFIERTLVHEGVSVAVNQRAHLDDGAVSAEFDVVVSGKLGSTDFRWLIECRDRKEPAPTSWIEQLIGRRQVHGFDRVTAVSTSGFSSAAVAVGERTGIELREIAEEFSVASFSDWLVPNPLEYNARTTAVDSVRVFVPQETEPAIRDALLAVFRSECFRASKFFRNAAGEVGTADQAFLAAVRQIGTLFDDMEANGPDKAVRILVTYTEGLYIDLPEGSVRADQVLFEGHLRYIRKYGSVVKADEYRRLGEAEPIAQIVTMKVPSELELALEFRRVSATGHTHIVLKTGSA